MNAPNYVLHYSAKFKDDSLDLEYRFHAPDDTKAREIALNFVEERNRRNRQEVDEGKKSFQDSCFYESLGLDRISYVLKEVEMRTCTPL